MSEKKEETILTLDIGNTNVVLGIFQNDVLVNRRRLATQSGRTADEAGLLVKMFCKDGGVDPDEIDAIVIASVVPRIGMVYGEMSRTYLGCDPLYIHGEIPGFRNMYRNPKSVGADRVCDAVAGYEKYGGPLLILDFGTANTIDVIGEDGSYQGGIILPGFETSSEALHMKAALLPAVRLKVPQNVIGRTTEESIRVGLMHGAIGALKYLIAKVISELDQGEPTVIATGGMAPGIVPYLEEVSHVEPDLVLEGMRILYHRSSEW